MLSVPAFESPLTKVLGLVVTSAQWEVVTRLDPHFHVISSIIVGVLITIPVPRFIHVSRIYTSFSQSFTVICTPCVSIRASILLEASVVSMIRTWQFRLGTPSVSGF